MTFFINILTQVLKCSLKQQLKQRFEFALKHFLIIALVFSYSAAAQAQNITDVAGLVPDGSTNTITDRAPNQTPIGMANIFRTVF